MVDEQSSTKVTKSKIAKQLADKINVEKKQADEILTIFVDTIINALKSGDKVEIRGFGSFRVKQRNSKIGRNPRTGHTVDVPPKKTVMFRYSKYLKELLMGK
ncbi:MAG: HU family DNA-binding protein [Nitrospinota bacterium]